MYEGIKAKFKRVPTMMQAMGNSPAVLQAYLAFAGAMAKTLDPKLRERISLRVAQTNRCTYCLAAHTVIGTHAGLSNDDIIGARKGTASDPKTAAVLKFVDAVIAKKGEVSDADVAPLKDHGFTDAQLAEIVANVALDTFTNYFNGVGGFAPDFPAAPPLAD